MRVYKNLVLVVTLFFLVSQIYAQVPHINNSCFCVEESDAQPNLLYYYDIVLQYWKKSGAIVYDGPSPIKAERIEAIAINPVDKIIYAFDGAKFGTIDIGTEKFKLIKTNLRGTGKIKGSVINNFSFGDIDGLSYNPYTRELWATNRLDGTYANDILFKINPKTGDVIKGVFGGYDFVEIEENFDSTLGGSVYDVDDIAINFFTNQLFAIQNQNGPGIVSEVNPIDGSIETDVFDLNEDDIEGLGFCGYGRLYGTTGDNSDVPSSLIAIDFVNFSTQGLAAIDPTLNNGVGDFESFDCVSDYVDLALTAKTVNGQNGFNTGDIVEIDVTVHNQGTIEVDKVEITMHLPTSMSIVSNGWVNVGGAKRRRTINKNEKHITAGISYTFRVQLQLASTFTDSSNVPFEISKMENDNISIGQGTVISLPDVDSTPDSENFEQNVKNNEISQNGKFNNEDEDDHDIATISTGSCPYNLNLNDISGTMYSAENAILINGEVVGSTVELYAGYEITLNSGFEVEVGERLTCAIQACQ